MSNRLACIVQRFITVQIQVKTFHWQTYSYSRHKSTDRLFENLLELVDQFVETYMGKSEKRLDFQKTNHTIRLQNISEKKIVYILKQFAIFLTNLDNREKHLTSDLLNIRDEMLGVVHQTLYLLTLK